MSKCFLFMCYFCCNYVYAFFAYSSLLDSCRKHILHLCFLSFGIRAQSSHIQVVKNMVLFYISNLHLSAILHRRKLFVVGKWKA